MSKAALSGVRVADFAWAWAGAYSTTLLAYMGAEVIKIESAKRPDHTRRTSLTTAQMFEGLDNSPIFNDINANKLSVSLDLSQPRSIELAKRIVSVSDLTVQNMRPGVMERLGLGYEALRAVKPDIIYLSSSMRGGDGPERQYVGYAPNFAALAGLSHITGYADGMPTIFMGEVDLSSATTCSFALLAALNHRLQTGEGQHIDLSSSEATSVLIGEVFLDYTMNGRNQTRKGNEDGFMAPHNCYRCLGEDRWVSIAIANDEEWEAFCGALGSPAWAGEERFSNVRSRWQNQQELDRLIEEWTATLSSYEVMTMLQRVGVAAIPSFNSDELSTDPHLKERQVWVEVEHPFTGKQIMVAPPWKLSVTPAQISSSGPLLGGHNEHVFGELLGMSSAEIAQLIEEKVIY